MHFKKYARKWRLEDVLVTLVCLGTSQQNAANTNWYLAEFFRGGISVAEKVVLKIKPIIVECRRDRNIVIYIWSTFSQIEET